MLENFDELLQKTGLYHLKDRPEELRAEVLKRLGLSHLKDDPVEMQKAMIDKLRDNLKRLEKISKDLDEKILKPFSDRLN
jgi:hypothetical protein